MSLLGTGHTAPEAGSSAEAEALIAEARARARRRRQRIAVAVFGAAAMAAGTLVATGAFNGSRLAGTAHSRTPVAIAEPSGPPPYFMDATYMDGDYSSPEIRASATGKLVAPAPIGNVPALRGYDPPYGLAATGPGSFVVGMMTPSDCSTQFFRFRVNDRGRPGALTRVGPTLPGDLSSIAAGAGGGLIAYTIDGAGCANARALGSYLGVLDVSTGRTHRWTDVPRYSGPLSMSANGRLLAFTQTLTKPVPHSNGGFEILGDQVRVLATDAPPGTVAARSRVVASIATEDSGFSTSTMLLSPTGTSFYLCSEPLEYPKPGAKRITDTATIVTYDTATGKAAGVVASFATSYAVNRTASYRVGVSCSTMALDPSGRFLLVPYLVTSLNPADEDAGGSLTAARIDLATGARSDWTLRYGERQNPGTMSIAW
jgi:hypothetical protein